MHAFANLRRLPLIVLLAAGAPLCCAADAAPAEYARTLFVNKCCTCHRDDAEAAVIGPTHYAAFQWKKFFDADRHSRRKDISALITPEESEALKNFLMEHAADSDQPEGIGMTLQRGR